MKTNFKIDFKKEIFPLSLIILSFVVSVYFYLNFPQSVPIHWGIDGEVNGWGSPAVAAFLTPAITAVCYGILLLVPFIDPKKERYVEFEKPYHVFKNVVVLFVTVLHFMTGAYALGYNIPMGRAILVLVGFLFIIIGNYMGKIKSNWMIGVRTPWTLSNEDVWNKTNRLGGKLFVIGGLIFLLNALVLQLNMAVVTIAVLILVAVVPIVYSYVLFRKKKG
ncbi:MAG: SdpI family protein [Candidatus Gracilibacteria bacterium]|jgi:uncharacterized membrane protein